MQTHHPHQVFGRAAQTAGANAVELAARDISRIYADAFDLDAETCAIDAPPMPTISPPVALGQTIALDLSGGWWTRFWRRQRGYDAFSEDFSKLIFEETLPVVNALRHDNADPFVASMRAAIDDFLTTQRDFVTGLAQGQSRLPEPEEPDGRLDAAE